MLQIHTEKFQLAGMFRKFLSPFFQTNQMLDVLQRDFRLHKARRPSLYFLHHEWRLCRIYKSSPVDDRTTTLPLSNLGVPFLRIRPVADQDFIRINMSRPLASHYPNGTISTSSADGIEINQYASILCANPRCCRIA